MADVVMYCLAGLELAYFTTAHILMCFGLVNKSVNDIQIF